MLIPLALRPSLLVLVSFQTYSMLSLIPVLELANAFIPEDTYILIILLGTPLRVSLLLRTLRKYFLSSLLPLRRRKVIKKRLVLVPGYLLF